VAAENATDDDIAAETINSNHAWSAWRLTAPVQMTPGTPLVRLLLGRLSATGRHGKRILRPGGGQGLDYAERIRLAVNCLRGGRSYHQRKLKVRKMTSRDIPILLAIFFCVLAATGSLGGF